MAQAITDLKLIGKVYSAGVATPKPMANYIKSGAQAKVVLWDAKNLGYLTAWTGAQLAEGKQFAPSNNVSEKLPAINYDAASKTLLLGPPLAITKDNVDQFQY